MPATLQYKAAGVDLDAASHAVELMKSAVRATYTPAVLADVGSFGGLYALTDLPASPVLVASTDGVGTKVKLAADLGRWQGIGHDIVNHCVNDILVQNAQPLFLDYLAASKLIPERMATVVAGMAEACKAVGCALLGGETAEMPGVYTDGAFDVVGTVVGIASRERLWPQKEAMQAGDLIIGLPSSGPHTNGYSLIRKLVAGRNLDERLEDGIPIADSLLAPHACYLETIQRLQAAGVVIHGLAHITGGGFYDNIPRVLPTSLAAHIDPASWRVPAIFQALTGWGGLDEREAFRVFNMGIGMVIIVPADQLARIDAAQVISMTIGQLASRAGDEGPVQISRG